MSPAESRGHHPSWTPRQAQLARGPLSSVGELGEGCSLRARVRVPGLIGSWSDGEKHATMTLHWSGQRPPRTLHWSGQRPPRTLRQSRQ